MNSVKKNRFKYGSLAIGLTVAVIAFVIVINAVLSALSNHFFWYFDMTPGQIYSISVRSTEYVDKIDGETNKITIYFFTDKDSMTQSVSSNNSLTDTSMWGMKPIHELALQLSDRYSFISLDYIDPTGDPDRIRKIVGDDYYATSTFTSRNVLIVNDTYEKNADGTFVLGADQLPVKYTDFKLCSRNSFYLFDHTSGLVNAFRGDYYFASSIMSLTKINKTEVYFLTGHGESVGDAKDELPGSFGDAMALYYVFEESGCRVKKIDLKYDDFSVNTENAILVIYAPQRDITAPATTLEVSEKEKIEAFLEKDGNSMMVFFDTKSAPLTNLGALVAENAGVSVSASKAHASSEASVSVDGYSIVGEYAEGAPAVDRILAEDMGNKVVFRDAYPIVINNASVAKAVVRLPEAAGAGGYSEEAALMTVSDAKGGGKILVSASADFANNQTLESDVYGNKNLLISSLDDIVAGDVPLNFDIKLIRSEGLDRTERQAIIWTLVLSVLIPAAVAIFGTVVYVRRKHS